MMSTKFVSAFAAAAVLSMASAQSSGSSTVVSIATPTASVAANAMTDMGCFSDPRPLEDHGSYTFQSDGNCQLICLNLQKNVLGLSDGTNCWCGDMIPPKGSKVDNSSCDTPCSGTDKKKCGGPSLYWVSLTGLTKNRIQNFEPESAASSASSTNGGTAQGTQGQTVIVTATGAPPENKSSSPNKAGIAAGVVVGVVALAAIIGGVVLFLRQKKRQAVEEEYRRQAAANSFMSGGKLHTSNSSMTDSRLDPEFMNRRASNGSIADNEDYSRRILKVTNA